MVRTTFSDSWGLRRSPASALVRIQQNVRIFEDKAFIQDLFWVNVQCTFFHWCSNYKKFFYNCNLLVLSMEAFL